VLVCASQLRWGLTSSEPVGSLSPGTLILAQQNQQLLQFQHGTRGTYNSRETSSFIGTALSVNDIPRFMPDLAVVPSADGGLKKHTVDGGLKKPTGPSVRPEEACVCILSNYKLLHT
jgi:hypothetical protein